MSLFEKYQLTIISLPLTILGILICVFLAGGGHGTYTPSIILFPYAMLTSLAEKMIGPFSIVLALTQFTAYGLIIDLTKWTKRGLQVGIILLLLHVLTTAIVLINKGDTF